MLPPPGASGWGGSVGWAENARYWRALPRRSTALFLLGVFSTFASIGFISANIGTERPDPGAAVLAALFYGSLASLWAFAGTRKMTKTMIGLFVGQFVVGAIPRERLEQYLASHAVDPETFRRYSSLNGAAAVGLIIVGYIGFVLFTRREGIRYYSTFTEMSLAQEMHRVAVPEISRRHGGYEMYGISWPSGEVGGDLVDFVPRGEGWVAYVADVSGHGVRAGTLMTMVKSAARMPLRSGDPATLLGDLNAVLAPISAPNMFVTAAFLSPGPGSMTYGLAAHLPLLRYRAATKTVEELAGGGLPVGVVAEAAYAPAIAPSEPGDLFAILTDGFTEVVDRSDRDLGLAPLKAVLAGNAGAPLPAIAEAMRERARKHGAQTDDQSVFLARRLS